MNLIELANKYETTDFLQGDPSFFMHQVEGTLNQETIAFIASALSYGSRKQFMAKIQSLLRENQYEWVKSGLFLQDISDTDDCFYRLYSMRKMRKFLLVLQKMLLEYNSIGDFVRLKSQESNDYTALFAIKSITTFFAENESEGIIPRTSQSCCKRLCMFLRWMVRDNSPVDLGLWEFIDKRSLIMPMDTHVIQQAQRLGLLATNGKTINATMKMALQLTNAVSEYFPDDPLKADFALFGYGVNNA